MSCRLVIITEIIAPYRIPVFNLLARTPGIELHVIFLADTDSTQRQWKVYKDEINFSYEVLPNWRKRFGRKAHLLLNRGVSSALNRTAPDVLVCGGYNYPACWQALLWAKSQRIPALLWCESTAHDWRTNDWMTKSAKHFFVRKCSGFVVPGISSRDYVRGFGIADDKITLAPDAVDTGFFAEESAAALAASARRSQELQLPASYFLYVGRLVKEKGIFHLLDAYEKISPQAREKFSLVFVGDGKDRARLLARAASIRPGKVHWAGFVHREQLPAYYALAEAFILPTLTDPWGLVVNEAMACGLPIIVTQVAGCAADLVTHQWNGFVVAPADVQQLSRAMQKFTDDPALRHAMGQRSRERIVAYSPERCAQGLAASALQFNGQVHV